MNVRPTQSDYLAIKKRLERTREGHELLEQKRQILVLELMAQVEAAGRVKEQIAETMAAAYDALRKAVLRSGISGLMRQSCGIAMDHTLTFQSRSVMGVPLPEVRCVPERFALQFGLSDGRAHTDLVLKQFLEAVGLVAELAQVENAVIRLAREVKRTQRRVNALEKTYIPQYEKDLRVIEGALTERQRDEFIVLRKVKRKRRRAAAERRAVRHG